MDCPAPYTSDRLLADLAAAKQAIVAGDPEAATRAGAAQEAGLPCLEEALPSMIFAQVYLAIGSGRWLAGDPEAARRWWASAIALDPLFEGDWPELPVGAAWRAQLAEQREGAPPAPVQASEGYFPEGTHYLDGRRVQEPRAIPGVPHVYQRQIGEEFRTFLIVGSDFPGLVPIDPSPRRPRPVKVDRKSWCDRHIPEWRTPEGLVVMTCNPPPPEKAPLMKGGALLVLGAGVLTGFALDASADARNADTPAEREEARRRAKTLGIAAGMTFGAGTLSFGWGVIIADPALPRLR